MPNVETPQPRPIHGGPLTSQNRNDFERSNEDHVY